jgi:Family of unknown function (DUF6325)
MSATSPPGGIGPVEWAALTFPGPVLDPAVAGPLADLVGSGTVRVLDAAVVHKDAAGDVTETELEDEGVPAFDDVDGEVLELLSEDDLRSIAETLEPDTTTLVLLWENVWATAFTEAVRGCGGTVLANERVPRAALERALAAAAPDGGPA